MTLFTGKLQHATKLVFLGHPHTRLAEVETMYCSLIGKENRNLHHRQFTLSKQLQIYVRDIYMGVSPIPDAIVINFPASSSDDATI